MLLSPDRDDDDKAAIWRNKNEPPQIRKFSDSVQKSSSYKKQTKIISSRFEKESWNLRWNLFSRKSRFLMGRRFCAILPLERKKNLFLKHRRSFSFLWPRWWTFCNFDDDRLVEELVMNDSTLYNCGKFYWICPTLPRPSVYKEENPAWYFCCSSSPKKSFSRFSFFQTRLEFKSKQKVKKVREEENRTPLSCCVR